MSTVKKVFLLLLTLVGLFVVSIFTFDYNSVLSKEDRKNLEASAFEEYITKANDLKEKLMSKINLFANESTSKNQPIDLQLIKKDGVVLLNGIFKDEKQAQEVADLLNVNREGEYNFEENRVKDVVLLNKLSSLMIAYKDFFSDGSKLSVENGQVLLNGQLRDSSYRALFDSILAKSKIDIISNIKDPTLSEAQEIVENERTKEIISLVDTEEIQDIKVANENESIVTDEIKSDELIADVYENKQDEELLNNDNQSNFSQKTKQIQLDINSILSKNKINFKRRSTTITKESYSSVKEISEILKDNPNIKIEIAGHTDSRGKSSLNKRISQDRANSVKTALVALGVSKDNLTAVGYGEDFPIAKDDANGLSEINRRVEFNIVGE